MNDTTQITMKSWNETIQGEISILEKYIASQRCKESIQQLCVFDFDGTLVGNMSLRGFFRVYPQQLLR